MVMPSLSNAVSLSQVQTEFGGTNPISISEYYANANPNYTGFAVGGTSTIPNISSPFKFSYFWGKSKETERIFTTEGYSTWTVPTGVTSVSVVCVGKGGTASFTYGGGGGALAWINNYNVTAGEVYSIKVGDLGSRSSHFAFYDPITVTIPGAIIIAYGGSTTDESGGAHQISVSGYVCGGGNGGNGGYTQLVSGTYYGGGGGGAAGYTGNGGNGASLTTISPTPGSGGGGGGGSGGNARGGGGVGLYGQGANGAAGGGGGSGGTDALPNNAAGTNGGGQYGGGGGSVPGTVIELGAPGAVRIAYNAPIGPAYTNHTFALPTTYTIYKTGTYPHSMDMYLLSNYVTNGSGYFTFSVQTGTGNASLTLSIVNGTLRVTIASAVVPNQTYNNIKIRCVDNRNANWVVDSTISITVAGQQQVFTTVGTSQFTIPAGVTSICMVCVGGGANLSVFNSGTGGGGGGALAWLNDYPVTPGTVLNITVGGAGSASSVKTAANVNIVTAGGGNGRTGGSPSWISTTLYATGGGKGGFGGYGGGTGNVINYAGGGGGAGGYSGDGGNGAWATSTGGTLTNYAATGAATNSGGGGGGGVDDHGGGVGLNGRGVNGASGGTGPGLPGSGGVGGLYGGGGGNKGAVRIIWGAGRAFPTTMTTDNI